MAWSSVLWLPHKVRWLIGKVTTWSVPALARGGSSFGMLTLTVAVLESVSPSESDTVSLMWAKQKSGQDKVNEVKPN